jgi:hypothetical protein
VRTPRQQSQHAGSILWVTRFAEDGVTNHDDRVCAEHTLLRAALKNGQRFLPRQPLRATSRRFTGKRRFVDVGRLDREWNPGNAQ